MGAKVIEAYYGGLPADPDSQGWGSNRSSGKPMPAVIRVSIGAQWPNNPADPKQVAYQKLQKANEGTWFVIEGSAGSPPTFTRDPRKATLYQLVQAMAGRAARADEVKMEKLKRLAPPPFRNYSGGADWTWDFATMSARR